MWIFRKLNQLLRDESGATAIEYGLIATLIGVAIIGAVSGFASETSEMWQHVEEVTGDAMDK